MMGTRITCIFLFGVLLHFNTACFAQGRKLDLFEKDILLMEREDVVSPPPKGAVLFVGSSSIKRWKTLSADMSPMPVINRGFGGSTLAEAEYYFHRIIYRHNPRILVVYSGENDLHSKWLSFDTVIADFNRFRARVRQFLPNTRCFFISVKHSPSRWNSAEKFDQANMLISEFCRADSQWEFIDVRPFMAVNDGTPDSELFTPDCLHLNERGYAIWAREVRRAVLPVWESVSSQPLMPHEPHVEPEVKKPVEKTKPSGWLIHKVRSGETLSSLGRKYGVPYSKIKEWNGLRSDRIQVGQKLKIKTQNR
jgi:lysophospholipase L1-like esterase